MPELIYKDKLPPPEEFTKAVSSAWVSSNPVEDLLVLANQLWAFEQEYQMLSADFYEKYQAGLLEDELQHCFEWSAAYDFFIETKRLVESALPNRDWRLVNL
ncbi:MAG TPA: hypothetical protein EYP41_16740 [Anaerolineae bacterium]|nr:hypothetical protein [Anaerolineae bacterium]HIP70693.1 hypothetical protein [Anaerolineae bacterium]